MTSLLRNTNSNQVTVKNVTAYGYVSRTANTGREMYEMALQAGNIIILMYGESPYPIGYGTLKRYARFANDLYENNVPIQDWQNILQDYQNNQGRAKLQNISCYQRWVIRNSRAGNRRFCINFLRRKNYKGQSLQSFSNRPLSSIDIEYWKREKGYLSEKRF